MGKSALHERFVHDRFPSYNYCIGTSGVELRTRTLEVDGADVKLELWDTAGQERFGPLSRLYYRGTNGVLIAFDPRDKASFDKVRVWFAEAKGLSGPGTPVVLVSTKADLPTGAVCVTQAEENALAGDLGVPLFRTSAKTNEGVPALLLALVKLALNGSTLWSPMRSAWCVAVARAVHVRHYRRRASSFKPSCVVQ